MQRSLSRSVKAATLLFILLSAGVVFGQGRELVEVTSTLSQAPGVFEEPNFVPQKEWSIKYVQLFKQALREKYGVDEDDIDSNLIIVSVVKGTQSDGFAIPFTNEKFGRVNYIYKIDWAYFSPFGLKTGFGAQDESGRDLTDQQILESIKETLPPVFTVKGIISKEQAVSSCDPSAEFPALETPWYSNDNNIRFDEPREELVFYCKKTISQEGNRCLTETFSLETGEKLDSRESACIVYGAEAVSDELKAPVKNLVLFAKSISTRVISFFYYLFNSLTNLFR